MISSERGPVGRSPHKVRRRVNGPDVCRLSRECTETAAGVCHHPREQSQQLQERGHGLLIFRSMLGLGGTPVTGRESGRRQSLGVLTARHGRTCAGTYRGSVCYRPWTLPRPGGRTAVTEPESSPAAVNFFRASAGVPAREVRFSGTVPPQPLYSFPFSLRP